MKEISQNSRVRLGIFGVGMHFQETYSMALRRSEIRDLVDVAWVVDLETKRDLALKRCSEAKQSPVFLGVDKFSGSTLPKHIESMLNDALETDPVDAVLVSTTPEQHRAYAEWAISKKLDVIIDKPITTRPNAAWDKKEAAGIYEDWESITSQGRKNDVLVLVNAHRRFHPGYKKVSELLEQVSRTTNIGMTALSSFSSDGQWRLPQEVKDIHYHGYENGNGVLSHFGYHYLDLAMLWYIKGTPKHLLADSMNVSSTFSSASNYVGQVSSSIANNALSKIRQPKVKDNDASVKKSIMGFGEVDAFCSLEMMRGEKLTAHMSVQLLHSGFSQRTWTKPAENLYKENGRVRWENHLIQQGPFQSIEIRSFQAVQPNWKHPDENIPRWDLGGSDHLEIVVYRNKLLGKPPLEVINCRDLLDEIPEHDVMHEDTKAKTLLLFLVAIAKKRNLQAVKLVARKIGQQVDELMKSPYDISVISSHQATVSAMSASYESHATSAANKHATRQIRKEIIW